MFLRTINAKNALLSGVTTSTTNIWFRISLKNREIQSLVVIFKNHDKTRVDASVLLMVMNHPLPPDLYRLLLLKTHQSRQEGEY